MIYTLAGRVSLKAQNFFVLDVGGVGFKVFSNQDSLAKVVEGESAKIFCFLYVREDQLELYGFAEEQALKLFEMLNTVSGIGPKTALGILDTDSVPNIMAAILEKKVEFLTRTSGIGRKTAERIILELHNKIKLPESKALTEKMSLDIEVEEALAGLGYRRADIKKALAGVGPEAKTLEERLRKTLKILSQAK
jgi:Holliday junction DNA helicase RuvA